MVRDLGRVTLCTSYSGMREGRAKNHSFVSKTNKQTNKSNIPIINKNVASLTR